MDNKKLNFINILLDYSLLETNMANRHRSCDGKESDLSSRKDTDTGTLTEKEVNDLRWYFLQGRSVGRNADITAEAKARPRPLFLQTKTYRVIGP